MWHVVKFSDQKLRFCFIQSSLEFRKQLVYKEGFLKHAKLLVYLLWPFTEKSTLFINPESDLVLLTCSILSSKSEPLVHVDLVFWRDVNKCILYFFLESRFFAIMSILSIPLFWVLKWTALCPLSKSCILLTTLLPLNWYLKSVYRHSTCW